MNTLFDTAQFITVRFDILFRSLFLILEEVQFCLGRFKKGIAIGIVVLTSHIGGDPGGIYGKRPLTRFQILVNDFLVLGPILARDLGSRRNLPRLEKLLYSLRGNHILSGMHLDRNKLRNIRRIKELYVFRRVEYTVGLECRMRNQFRRRILLQILEYLLNRCTQRHFFKCLLHKDSVDLTLKHLFRHHTVLIWRNFALCRLLHSIAFRLHGSIEFAQ